MYRSRKSDSTSDHQPADNRRRRGSTAKRSAFSQKSNHTQKRTNGQTVSAVPKVRTILEDDDDLNSGFARYMRSGEGFEMMKLFILGNTLVIAVTCAWPHLRETFAFLRSWYNQSD